MTNFWRKRQQEVPGYFVVCARLGDGFYQTARARLIWAAHTAQAAQDLGYPTLLTASKGKSLLDGRTPQDSLALARTIKQFYGVGSDFKTLVLRGEKGGEYGQHEAEELFPRYVAPHAALVHTRDPRVVRYCISNQIPVIYEDHNEDFHISSDLTADELNDVSCIGIVAITEYVAARLELFGARKSKILKLDSGLSSLAFTPPVERANSWRSFLLRDGRKKLAIYTGGLQQERGIDTILEAAARMPSLQFALAGGNDNDIRHWVARCRSKGLSNIKFLGYLPQDEAIALQHAADLLLMTRAPGGRAGISSPLKFFEYLATGRQILASRTSVLGRFEDQQLDVEWYDRGDPVQFFEKLRNIFQNDTPRRTRSGRNIDVAREFVWSERQRRIIEAFDIERYIAPNVKGK